MTIVLSLFCLLVGLVILCIQKRWNELTGGLYLAGLIAVLLQFAGYASLHLK